MYWFKIIISLTIAFFLSRQFGESPNFVTNKYYFSLNVQRYQQSISSSIPYFTFSLPGIDDSSELSNNSLNHDSSFQSGMVSPTSSTPQEQIPITETSQPTNNPLPTTQPTTLPNQPTNIPIPTDRPIPTTPPPQPTQLPTIAPGITCPSSSGESYSSLSVSPEAFNPQNHGDINLALRSYSSTSGVFGLVDINGPTDSRAPKLSTMLNGSSEVLRLYQVYNWNFSSNSRGSLITSPDVTLIGLKANPGQEIRVPSSGYSIGGGNQVIVLYAESSRLTLKYTLNDNVVSGYTIHIEGICTDPNLISSYNQLHSNGRTNLPALPGGKKLGVAKTNEVKVSIRDTGSFMDPRSRKDWW